ncbi:MAG: NAD(P)-dependent oxidoreductase [Pseudomonadales bacterium]
MRVGFIGLGNIGRPMARHLTGGDTVLQVYDVFEEPIQELVELGAESVSPAQMARDCDVIGICVRDNADVENLLYDEGMLDAATPATVFAIHSTVTQQGIYKWAEDARQKDLYLVDAPVTGGAIGAEAGELIYMVGAEEALFELCKPVFMHSAKNIVHAGGLGTGIALKLCINMMTYSAFIAIRESTELAKAAGLDPEVLYEVGRGNGMVSDFNHRFISGHEAVFASCDDETVRSIFEPFGKLGEKDLAAALQTAQALNVALPSAQHNSQLILDTFIKR